MFTGLATIAVGSPRIWRKRALYVALCVALCATAASCGEEPTGMAEPTTALVAVSITETVPLPRLVTYARPVAGLIATADGWLPTAMVLTTAPVAVSITDTVLEDLLAT